MSRFDPNNIKQPMIGIKEVASNVLEEAYKGFLSPDHNFFSLPVIRDGIHYGLRQTPLFAELVNEKSRDGRTVYRYLDKGEK